MPLSWIAILFASTTLIGCGSSGPFDYVKIKGTVKYDTGEPVPDGVTLRFDPQDATPVGVAHPRTALAHLKDGKFDTVTSYKYGDGLIPGKHTVFFQDATDSKGGLLVPKDCLRSTTSPLTIDTSDSPITIEVPKPEPSS